MPATIAKNLKLLFRSKESAYTIVFGPLLIILLVSFALIGSSDEYTIRVGTYAPATTDFSARVVETLGGKDYLVNVYPTQEACVEGVTQGTMHACLVFSEKEAGNGTIPVTFYLDMSRTNIIYKIADDLSGALDLEADALRTELAQDAITRMQTAAVLVDRSRELAERADTRMAAAAGNLTIARSSLNMLINDSPNVSLTGLRGYQLGLAGQTHTAITESLARLDEAEKELREMDRSCNECTEAQHDRTREVLRSIDDTREKLEYLDEEESKDLLFDADLALTYAIEDLADLNRSLANDSKGRAKLRATITAADASIAPGSKDLAAVSTQLRYTSGFLNGQEVDASAMATPVEQRIVSVTVADDRLSFTYPYLLVLIIMFIGLLLASTLVVQDKTSRASFRNFTTPTSDEYQIAAAFLTAFLLLLLEIGIIILASVAFVTAPLLLNPGTTMLLVLVAIVIFTFLGMIIGYLATTQEAAMISSITVGSVLLFISNLIIPVEGMARFAQWTASLNPYLVLSELLRKSMLYGVGAERIVRELVILGIIVLVLFFLAFWIYRRNKRTYFRQESVLASHVPTPLALGSRTVANEVELLDALDRMTRAEFEAIVTADENVISVWVRTELRNTRLAKRLRTRNKERMMLQLDAYLKRHGKTLRA
jgi:ABC-type multidrug transport system permease subunit